jgi:hypothetical protein
MDDPIVALPQIAHMLGNAIRSIHVRRPALRDVFLGLTGRRFDDEST